MKRNTTFTDEFYSGLDYDEFQFSLAASPEEAIKSAEAVRRMSTLQFFACLRKAPWAAVSSVYALARMTNEEFAYVIEADPNSAIISTYAILRMNPDEFDRACAKANNILGE
jgi:hypothetical protein